MGVFDKDQDKDFDYEKEDTRINSVSPFEITDAINSIADVVSKTNNVTVDVVNKLRGWGDGFQNLLEGIPGGGVARRENGLIAKGIPPPDAYEECKRRNGMSVWDQQGWWNCIFPREQFANSMLLSKEDIENDTKHENGLFFNNVDDLLNWQATMRKNMKKVRSRNWQTSFTESDSDDSEIVSRVQTSCTKSLSNGDLKRTTTEKIRLRDGSRSVIEREEILAPDGTVKESTETTK